MKTVLFVLTLSFFSTAFAASEYKCGAFENAEGVSKLDLSASVVESDKGDLTLFIGKKMGIASEFKMKLISDRPVFNLYSYKAGPYYVYYYQNVNQFVVKKSGFKATCNEVK